MPWSVQTWLPGTVATPDGQSEAFAHDLAEFIEGVRAIDTRGRTFSGDNRGGHLPDHDAWMETCLERSEGLLDVPPLRRLWAAFRELPREGGDVMTHGDLIPGNLLVDGGRLAGVIDVGGLGPADPALDLVAAWHLLDPGPREAFRADLRCGDLEWARGRRVGVRAGHGSGLVLRRDQPAHEPHGPAHAGTAHRGRRSVSSAKPSVSLPSGRSQRARAASTHSRRVGSSPWASSASPLAISVSS